MPTDTRFDDGYRCLISFSENPTIKIWIIDVKPPGWDGGGAIETATMENDDLRTKRPKALVTATNSSCQVAYALSALRDIREMINVLQEITITYPDSAGTETFWGWVNTFEPSSFVEGTRPTASMEIIPANEDDTGAESIPTFT